jgi:hypothetical protein
MTRSDTIQELAAALAKAQGEMGTAKKGNENPHFRSKYADLASVWDACRAALTKHNLSVIQSPRMDGNAVQVQTMLLHASGQWVADTLTVPVGKQDAQGVGSAITYARRYALAAFVSVAPDDDDGGAAQMHLSVTVPAPAGYSAWKDDMEATVAQGSDALKAAWSSTDVAIRTHASAQDKAWLARLREKAKAA